MAAPADKVPRVFADVVMQEYPGREGGRGPDDNPWWSLALCTDAVSRTLVEPQRGYERRQTCLVTEKWPNVKDGQAYAADVEHAAAPSCDQLLCAPCAAAHWPA